MLKNPNQKSEKNRSKCCTADNETPTINKPATKMQHHKTKPDRRRLEACIPPHHTPKSNLHTEPIYIRRGDNMHTVFWYSHTILHFLQKFKLFVKKRMDL